MKKIIFLITFFLHSLSFAECPYTFSCTQQGCVKVTDLSCSIPTSLTPSPNLNNDAYKANPQGANFVAPNPSQNSNSKIYPSQTYGCAENGSCYGDISSVNGMPKTVQVDGYYRSNGTYVRGHYRSK